MKRMKKMIGFTLIELLIVVAIIAILAAIAIPNFLEAQVRSKVSRCRTDMRTTLTALESYMVDTNKYPPMYDSPWEGASDFHARTPNYLTTPIAYMTSLCYDPFVAKSSTWSSTLYPIGTRVGERYAYFNVAFLYASPTWGPTWRANELESRAGAHVIYGYGPDKDPFNWGARTMTLYDPTNGTVSAGNIIRTQKNPEGIGPRSDGTW